MKSKPKVKFVIGKSGNQKGNVYFKVYGGNGELICSSEGYTSKSKAKKGAFATWAALNYFVCSEDLNDFTNLSR